MFWFNYVGLIFVVIMLIPNIVYAIKNTDKFENSYKNKLAIICEQIGRYGCMFFMIFNIPHTYFGFWFNGAIILYIAGNGALCAAYVICWLAVRSNTAKALVLSVLPSCIFLFSGAMLASVPLLICSSIFAPCHILISYKNAN